jgi:PemK-like protein.
MTRKLQRGTVVLAQDPYSGKTGKRPFVIISDSDYPFYPNGYLGIPVTSQDKSNTFQIHEYDKVAVKEDLHIDPSYVNPWSPSQVNDAGRKLLRLSDDFCDISAREWRRR